MSTTSTSTSAATSAPARSNASVPTPTAAPTRSRPCSSFVASGYSIRFRMSLTVIRPMSRPSASTIGSFSIRCRCRIASASSRVVPTGAVTRSRLVITAETGVAGVGAEAQVAVGEDADQDVGLVGDRDPRDLVAGHQRQRVRDERVGPERDGLDDHPGLGALDLVDLGDLILDREVAVDDPDPALAREGDREPRLGDGVHRRGDDRDLDHDRAGEARGGAHVVRQHRRLGREQEDVVEGQALLAEFRVPIELPVQVAILAAAPDEVSRPMTRGP